jgi:hypothetical protein
MSITNKSRKGDTERVETVDVLAVIDDVLSSPTGILADEYFALENARAVVADLIAHVETEYADLADTANQWVGRCSVAGQERLCRMRDLIAKAHGRDSRDVQDEFTIKRSIERAACGATK